MSTNHPIEKIRVGAVQISLWQNEGAQGPFITGRVELSYKDGEQWRTSNSYGARDLVNLAKAALLAHSAIGKLRHAQGDEPDVATSDE